MEEGEVQSNNADESSEATGDEKGEERGGSEGKVRDMGHEAVGEGEGCCKRLPGEKDLSCY